MDRKGGGQALHYISDDGAVNARSLLIWQVAGIGLLMLYALVRFWPAFSRIGLYVEDALLFNHYYAHEKGVQEVLRSHIGQRYLTVPADFFAWVYAWADVRWQPWLYQWTGFAATLGAVSLLSFSGLIRRRATLLLSPLLLGLLGLNDLYYYNTLIYIMYTGVLMLLMLFLFPPPESRLSLTAQLAGMLVLPWSGPYSVLALPATLFLFFRTANRTKRILLLTAFCSTLFYCLTVTGSNLKLSHVWHFWIVERYFSEVLDKIIFFDFFTAPPLVFWLPVAVLLLICCWMLKKDQDGLSFTVVVLGYVFVSVSLFFFSVKFAQYTGLRESHLVVASFFWVAFLMVSGERCLERFHPFYLASFVCFLLLLLTVDSVRHGEKWKFKPVPDMHRFIETIAHYEQQGLVEKKQSACLHLPPQVGSMMAPMVVVGYRKPGALRLSAEDSEITLGKDFMCLQK